jgi:hypothetical protein
MKTNLVMLIIFLNIGCYGQVDKINGVIQNSSLIELPINYEKLSGIKGDSLQEKFKKELSSSQYYLNIKDKDLLNKPLLFQNISLIGKVNLSSKYDIAIFREDINLNNAFYYLFSFSKNGKLLSALRIIERGYVPNVYSTISTEKVINIKEEYEDHVENYNFILQDDGIFKRTGYSEEKL